MILILYMVLDDIHDQHLKNAVIEARGSQTLTKHPIELEKNQTAQL